MKATRHQTALFSLTVAVAVAALAGCGTNGASSPAPSASSVLEAPQRVDAVASLVPATIASKGTLTFAMDATYPPDEFMSSDGHTIVGFDADIANALAPVMGLKPVLLNVTFDNIIPGLQSGKYDVGLSSFTDTREREKVVDFVTYFQAGEGFYVKAGSGKKFDGLASLCGHTVAVENGTVSQTDAQGQAQKCDVKILTFDTQNEVNLAVSSGRADVGFADSQVVDYIVKQANGQFETTGSAFAVAPYGIAVQKGSGLAEAVLAALQSLIKDGTYTKILDTWGVKDGAISTPVINGAVS